MWQGTCEEVLGRRKTQHKEWISGDIMKKVEEKKEKKAVLNTSRTRSAKTKAQEGYTVTDKQIKKIRKTPTPETPPDNQPANTDLPINCDKPTKTEIRRAINKLQSRKAARPDEIPAESIKADIETVINILYNLVNKILEEENIPEERKEGILIKMPKKGDLRDCSNYLEIMLQEQWYTPVQWTLLTQLDDLDFADDLALLSNSQSKMQDKTTHIATPSTGTGLIINVKKTELMKINTTV
ncbi:uncharacterized protein LOC134281729 [Saccostrea cucullata]|uniref:uncharacterized protein LOC134281729 n=1 Tax=Saccostrea cuccullata TaxID=36930 RepID=UPI002ED30E23